MRHRDSYLLMKIKISNICHFKNLEHMHSLGYWGGGFLRDFLFKIGNSKEKRPEEMMKNTKKAEEKWKEKIEGEETKRKPMRRK